MFDTMLVKLARDGRTLGLTHWAPMLPSFQFPTVTWADGIADGSTDTVSRVDFPDGQPIEITFAGDVAADEVQPRYLDRGWRVLPGRTTNVLPVAAGEKPQST